MTWWLIPYLGAGVLFAEFSRRHLFDGMSLFLYIVAIPCWPLFLVAELLSVRLP